MLSAGVNGRMLRWNVRGPSWLFVSNQDMAQVWSRWLFLVFFSNFYIKTISERHSKVVRQDSNLSWLLLDLQKRKVFFLDSFLCTLKKRASNWAWQRKDWKASGTQKKNPCSFLFSYPIYFSLPIPRRRPRRRLPPPAQATNLSDFITLTPAPTLSLSLPLFPPHCCCSASKAFLFMLPSMFWPIKVNVENVLFFECFSDSVLYWQI